MITGELKSKVDRIWDTMWSGGISNPLSVIEQLTYLLFIKRLDELDTCGKPRTCIGSSPRQEQERPSHPEGYRSVRKTSQRGRARQTASEGAIRLLDGSGHLVTTVGPSLLESARRVRWH